MGKVVISAVTDISDVIRTIVDPTVKNLVHTQTSSVAHSTTVAGPGTSQIRDAAPAVFESRTAEIARAEGSGRSPSEARSIAGFAVSAIEGALLRPWCARSPD
jgi:TetR/AcrR family transcriptional regulator, lmrAB and yxaGH operons repressor